MRNIGKKYENLSTKFSDIFSGHITGYMSVIIYKALLDIIYCCFIGGRYGFFYINPSIMNIINGWIIIFLMAFFMEQYYRQDTCSSIILIALNLVYFIPITTYCGYGGGSSSFLSYAIVYWVLLSLLQCTVPIVTLKRERKAISDKLISALIIMVSILTLYIWVKYSHFRIITNLLDVYQVRAEAATYSLPVVLDYLRQFSSIMIPMLVVLALYRKKYVLFAWLLFLTFLNFSYAGMKSVVFFLLILVCGYVFYRKKMIRTIFPMAIGLELFGIAEIMSGTDYIISLFFRRSGFVLGLLSEKYYRFFTDHTTDIFRNSLMGKLGFDSVYNQSVAKVIGTNYETQIINCNNGLLADVWANLGLIGLVIMPVILIFCFRLLDMASDGVEKRLIIGIILYYTMCFVNTTWSTVLMTHGFVLMCLGLFIFPRIEKQE